MRPETMGLLRPYCARGRRRFASVHVIGGIAEPVSIVSRGHLNGMALMTAIEGHADQRWPEYLLGVGADPHLLMWW